MLVFNLRVLCKPQSHAKYSYVTIFMSFEYDSLNSIILKKKKKKYFENNLADPQAFSQHQGEISNAN